MSLVQRRPRGVSEVLRRWSSAWVGRSTMPRVSARNTREGQCGRGAQDKQADLLLHSPWARRGFRTASGGTLSAEPHGWQACLAEGMANPDAKRKIGTIVQLAKIRPRPPAVGLQQHGDLAPLVEMAVEEAAIDPLRASQLCLSLGRLLPGRGPQISRVVSNWHRLDSSLCAVLTEDGPLKARAATVKGLGLLRAPLSRPLADAVAAMAMRLFEAAPADDRIVFSVVDGLVNLTPGRHVWAVVADYLDKHHAAISLAQLSRLIAGMVDSGHAHIVAERGVRGGWLNSVPEHLPETDEVRPVAALLAAWTRAPGSASDALVPLFPSLVDWTHRVVSDGVIAQDVSMLCAAAGRVAQSSSVEPWRDAIDSMAQRLLQPHERRQTPIDPRSMVSIAEALLGRWTTKYPEWTNALLNGAQAAVPHAPLPRRLSLLQQMTQSAGGALSEEELGVWRAAARSLRPMLRETSWLELARILTTSMEASLRLRDTSPSDFSPPEVLGEAAGREWIRRVTALSASPQPVEQLAEAWSHPAVASAVLRTMGSLGKWRDHAAWLRKRDDVAEWFPVAMDAAVAACAKVPEVLTLGAIAGLMRTNHAFGHPAPASLMPFVDQCLDTTREGGASIGATSLPTFLAACSETGGMDARRIVAAVDRLSSAIEESRRGLPPPADALLRNEARAAVRGVRAAAVLDCLTEPLVRQCELFLAEAVGGDKGPEDGLSLLGGDGLMQLRQVQLTMDALRPLGPRRTLDLPARLAYETQRAFFFGDVPATQTRLQHSVAETLRTETSVKPFVQEYMTHDHLFVDMAWPDDKVVLEIDGPYHFIPADPVPAELNPSTQWKTRMLRARGWNVCRIAYFEWIGSAQWVPDRTEEDWPSHPDARKKLLLDRLPSSVQQPSEYSSVSRPVESRDSTKPGRRSELAEMVHPEPSADESGTLEAEASAKSVTRSVFDAMPWGKHTDPAETMRILQRSLPRLDADNPMTMSELYAQLERRDAHWVAELQSVVLPATRRRLHDPASTRALDMVERLCAERLQQLSAAESPRTEVPDTSNSTNALSQHWSRPRLPPSLKRETRGRARMRYPVGSQHPLVTFRFGASADHMEATSRWVAQRREQQQLRRQREPSESSSLGDDPADVSEEEMRRLYKTARQRVRRRRGEKSRRRLPSYARNAVQRTVAAQRGDTAWEPAEGDEYPEAGNQDGGPWRGEKDVQVAEAIDQEAAGQGMRPLDYLPEAVRSQVHRELSQRGFSESDIAEGNGDAIRAVSSILQAVEASAPSSRTPSGEDVDEWAAGAAESMESTGAKEDSFSPENLESWTQHQLGKETDELLRAMMQGKGDDATAGAFVGDGESLLRRGLDGEDGIPPDASPEGLASHVEEMLRSMQADETDPNSVHEMEAAMHRMRDLIRRETGEGRKGGEDNKESVGTREMIDMLGLSEASSAQEGFDKFQKFMGGLGLRPDEGGAAGDPETRAMMQRMMMRMAESGGRPGSADKEEEEEEEDVTAPRRTLEEVELWSRVLDEESQGLDGGGSQPVLDAEFRPPTPEGGPQDWPAGNDEEAEVEQLLQGLQDREQNVDPTQVRDSFRSDPQLRAMLRSLEDEGLRNPGATTELDELMREAGLHGDGGEGSDDENGR